VRRKEMYAFCKKTEKDQQVRDGGPLGKLSKRGVGNAPFQGRRIIKSFCRAREEKKGYTEILGFPSVVLAAGPPVTAQEDLVQRKGGLNVATIGKNPKREVKGEQRKGWALPLPQVEGG